MTATLTEQKPFAGIVAPAPKLSVFPPTVAPGIPVPPHVVLAFGGLPMTTPNGNVSINGALSVATVGFGFISVTVSRDEPPKLIVEGLNDLLSAALPGASAQTVTVLPSSVTAPFKATSRPVLLVQLVMVTLLEARTLPRKRDPVPIVAELPICQKMLQLCPPLIIRTWDADAVVSALPI